MLFMNELPRKTLCKIITDYGVSIHDDSRRCEALLLDLCPSYRKEIRVLVGAIGEKIPHTLLNLPAAASIELIIPQLIERLVNNLAITREASTWSVHSWALALNVISDEEIKR